MWLSGLKFDKMPPFKFENRVCFINVLYQSKAERKQIRAVKFSFRYLGFWGSCGGFSLSFTDTLESPDVIKVLTVSTIEFSRSRANE